MATYSQIRKDALKYWKFNTNRVSRVTANYANTIECKWQNEGSELGYNHISVFCSLSQFASHMTDLLRDYRFDKFNYDDSEEVNELLFRYYSRILLIASEIFTDFQDLYIITDEKLTIKQTRQQLKGKDLRNKQDNAREILANGTAEIKLLLDFINKICKHKASNFHVCNNHIKYLFDDFHKNTKNKSKTISIGNIDNYTSYDESTLKKTNKPNFIVVPKLNYIIDLIMSCYSALDQLFQADSTKFDFLCKHYEDK